MNLMNITSIVNNLLDNLLKENKTVNLLRDFNIDLLNYDQHSPINELLGSLSSHKLLCLAKIGNDSKTQIDNIYSNVNTPNNISDNLTAKISDHLSQFLFVLEISSNLSSTKLNHFEKDWSKFY